MNKSTSLARPISLSPAIGVSDFARALFCMVGEDPGREGLQRTPERFAKAMLELTKGYALTGREAIAEGIFESESNGPVAVSDIEFFSLCEHHILPFWGKASVAYLPGKKILGLSKIARVIDVYSKRLQVQERLTAEIGNCIKDAILPRAVVVTVEAQHMCMMMRGVGKVGGMTRTEFIWRGDDVNQDEMTRLLAQLPSAGRG